MKEFIEIVPLKGASFFSSKACITSVPLLREGISAAALPYSDFYDAKYIEKNRFKKNDRLFLLRGDTRKPCDIKEVGGMHPKITNSISPEFERDDPLDVIVHREEDVQNSGLVSFTSDPYIARFFGVGGHVYIATTIGSISDAPQSNNPSPQEREYSVPGGVDWDQIVAYRQSDSNRMFTGKIFIRKMALQAYGIDVLAKISQYLLNTNENLYPKELTRQMMLISYNALTIERVKEMSM